MKPETDEDFKAIKAIDFFAVLFGLIVCGAISAFCGFNVGHRWGQ